jgi:hypothetical protein
MRSVETQIALIRALLSPFQALNDTNGLHDPLSQKPWPVWFKIIVL